MTNRVRAAFRLKDCINCRKAFAKTAARCYYGLPDDQVGPFCETCYAIIRRHSEPVALPAVTGESRQEKEEAPRMDSLKVTSDGVATAPAALPSSHTPGPWEINEGDGMAIAKVSMFAITAPCTADIGSGLSRDENLANARLIAAAPDLLAALKAILADPYGCPMCDSGKLRNPEKQHWPECGFFAARAAVAKAEAK